MKRLRIKKEQGIILCVWGFFLLVLPAILMDWGRVSGVSDIWHGYAVIWLRILSFLLLYILHHDGLMRWYPRKKSWYLTGLMVLMLLFGAWQFVDPHRPGPPHDHPGPPPHEMHPAEAPLDSLASPPPSKPSSPRSFDRPGPPPDGGRPHSEQPDEPHHPHGPEVSLILLGLLMVSGDHVGTLYTRKKRAEEMQKKEAQEVIADGQAPTPRELYFISDYHRVKVLVDDILYVQSMGEYIKIFRRSDAMPLITLYGIARLASELPEGQFVRIHRSYIVARSAIEKTSRSEVVLTGGTTLPVSATYKDNLSHKAQEK